MAHAQSQWYAEGLVEALEHADSKQGEKCIDAFFVLLKKRGHYSLLPSILRAFEASLRKRENKKTTRMIVARKEDVPQIAGSEHTPLTLIVDETIIGGSIIRTHDTRVDKSYKRSLEEMYYRMIEK